MSRRSQLHWRRRLHHWWRNLRVRIRLERSTPFPAAVRAAEAIAEAEQERLKDRP